MTKSVTVIGGGAAGSSIINNLNNSGFNVTIGLRSPEKINGAVSIKKALKNSEKLVIIALPYNAFLESIDNYKELLSGKIIVDMMNPLAADMSSTETFDGKSGAEKLQQELPDSYIVETFNHVDAPVLSNPKEAVQFVVGENKAAVDYVTDVAKQLDFNPQPINDLSKSKEVESFAFLWIYYSVIVNNNANLFLKLQ